MSPVRISKAWVIIGVVIIVLLSVSLLIPLALAEAYGDEMPREWFGKRKVVDRFGPFTRVALIHYVVDVGNPDSDGLSDGYEILGVWWDLNKYPSGIPYIVNPSQAVKSYGLSADSVVNEIKSALESWDLAVDLSDYEVDYVAYPSFVDVGSTTEIKYMINLYSDTPTIDNKARASIGYPDYKNVITWGRAQAGVVAYTVIWYISGTGEIVDADIVLNSYYKWGIADGDESTNDLKNKFDIRNIITHEAGHWSGLDDIYDSAYSAITMYGYTSYGEEIKRSLEPGDIAGVQFVYQTFGQ